MTKEARISSACRTPKILGKEGKNAQNRKEFLEKEKGKENQKGQEKKIRVSQRTSYSGRGGEAGATKHKSSPKRTETLSGGGPCGRHSPDLTSYSETLQNREYLTTSCQVLAWQTEPLSRRPSQKQQP